MAHPPGPNYNRVGDCRMCPNLQVEAYGFVISTPLVISRLTAVYIHLACWLRYSARRDSWMHDIFRFPINGVSDAHFSISNHISWLVRLHAWWLARRAGRLAKSATWYMVLSLDDTFNPTISFLLPRGSWCFCLLFAGGAMDSTLR